MLVVYGYWLAGIVIFARDWREHPRRRAGTAMLMAVILLPLVANTLYLAMPRLLYGYNLGMPAFIIAGLAFAWAAI